MIAVADSFDAMVSNRTYRKGLGIDKATDELLKCKGGQFDPDVVDAFFTLMNRLGKEEFMKTYCEHICGSEDAE